MTKKTIPPIFSLLRGACRSGGVKIWGGLFFLNNVKIENNDFITILGSVNLNIMMPSTNYCSEPTDNVPRGTLTHI